MLSPVILVVVLGGVGVFLTRRVWRYPLFLLGTGVLVGLGLGSSWWVPVGVLAGLGVGYGLWAWRCPASFGWSRSLASTPVPRHFVSSASVPSPWLRVSRLWCWSSMSWLM
ncbi:MAG: hypothetical protein ACRDTG_16195 [Pseudonocardiaceae bacterium]